MCDRPLPEALPGGTKCWQCRRTSPAFDWVEALADYRAEDPVRDWILAFKHGGRRDLARPLAAYLVELWERSGREVENGCLVPVPLHPLRRWERGYDQARELAEALGEQLSLPCVPALKRARDTPTQGAPGSRSRHANVRDAFALRASRASRIEGRSILLIDDVLTSGATADACARVLKGVPVQEVGVLCLGRAGGAAYAHEQTGES